MCEKPYFLLILISLSIGAVGCRQLNPFTAPPAAADVASDADEMQHVKLPISPRSAKKAAPYARSVESKSPAKVAAKPKAKPQAKPETKATASKTVVRIDQKSSVAAKPKSTDEPDPTVTPATKRLDIGSPPPIVIANAKNVPEPPPATETQPQPKSWLSLADTNGEIPKERSLAEQFAAENDVESTEAEVASTTEPTTNNGVTKLPPIDGNDSPIKEPTTAIALESAPSNAATDVQPKTDPAVRQASAVQLQGEKQKQAVIGFSEDQPDTDWLQQPKSFQGTPSADPPVNDGAGAATDSKSTEQEPTEEVRVEIDPAVFHAYDDLKSSDPSTQVRACRYLQQHGSPQHIEHLTPLMNSESLEVSLAATSALGSCGPWTQPKPLEDVLLNANLPRQAAASIALCQLGSPIGPAAIEQMSRNLNPEIRAAAASAAGILADPLFTAMLIRLLDDPTVARQAALSALPRCVGEQVAESGDSASQAATKWRNWYQSGGKSVSEPNAN